MATTQLLLNELIGYLLMFHFSATIQSIKATAIESLLFGASGLPQTSAPSLGQRHQPSAAWPASRAADSPIPSHVHNTQVINIGTQQHILSAQ